MANQSRKRAFSVAFQSSPEQLIDCASQALSTSSPPPGVPRLFGADQDNSKTSAMHDHVAAETEYPELDLDMDFEPANSAGSLSQSIEMGLGVKTEFSSDDTWSLVYEESEPDEKVVDNSAPCQSSEDIGHSSSPGPVLASCLDSDFTIYEDSTETSENIVTMPEQASNVGTATPSTLNFQDLSLFEGMQWSHSMPLANYWPILNRATYFVLESADLQNVFPDILPSDVIINFSFGKRVAKIDKQTLCAASNFIASLLSHPTTQNTTQCVRLRDDFPWIIPAMIEYLTTGTYSFDMGMLYQHPHMTTFDLHVHAYLFGLKYGMPSLHDYAIGQYLELGELIVGNGIMGEQGWGSENIYPGLDDMQGVDHNPDLYSDAGMNDRGTASGTGAYPDAEGYSEGTQGTPHNTGQQHNAGPQINASEYTNSSANANNIAYPPQNNPPNIYLAATTRLVNLATSAPTPNPQPLYPLLHSLHLLWRNTQTTDTLRTAVLDHIIKPHLNAWFKVPFFVSMMRYCPGFEHDLCRSVEEDGFSIRVLGLTTGHAAGRRYGVAFAYGAVA